MTTITQITRATNLIKSYLVSLNIPHTAVENQITINGYTVKIGSTDYPLDSILTKDPKQLESTVHKITSMAGYGTPSVLRQPANTGERVYAKDNFEKVYLRHKQFLRTCNVPTNDILQHDPLLTKISRRVYRSYKWVYDSMGFDQGDLLNIARYHLIWYLNHFGHPS